MHILKRALSSESWSGALRRLEKRISEAEASPSEIVILVPYKYTFFSKLVISSDCMEGIRGGIKKKKQVFFGVSPNERDPPAPPLSIWIAQIFSAKEILDWARPPPFFGGKFRKNSVFNEKNQYFMLKPFWNR